VAASVSTLNRNALAWRGPIGIIRRPFGVWQARLLRKAACARITGPMTAALLGIGTELTRGDLTNTNGSWLANELTQLGFEVAAIDVVDDQPERIVSALERLAARHEIVVCTGGLGPTTDDLTTACAAKALGVELELHQPSVAAITERLARYGRTLSASNEKQAYFPREAEILPNDWGTAPGFAVRLGQARLYFLPGVPSEMMALFEQRVKPSLGLPRERTPFEVLLHSFGLPESNLNDRLAGIAERHDVVIGYRVRFPEIDVKVHAKDPDLKKAQERAKLAVIDIEERLGPVVYGRGDVTLARALGDKLTSAHLELGVAESCTGGLTSSLLTAEAGASGWFRGGVVAYSNDIKTQLLGVAEQIIQQSGAVSVEAARAMAVGATQALRASVGLGITGIAGPDGGSADKPVGTVCFGIHGPFGTRCEIRRFAGERQRIQRIAAFHGLSLVLSALGSQPDEPTRGG
jgi:nicotinamide-nucleotide amidase